MFEGKKYNELLSPDDGYSTTELLILSYSMNPRTLEDTIRYTGLNRSYNDDLNLISKHVFCMLQADRASGAWDDPYVNLISQFLLRKGRIKTYPHKNKSFHPKLIVMLMKNIKEKEYESRLRIRVIIGSRNLTNEQLLEGVICLEGEVQDKELNDYSNNQGMIDLLKDIKHYTINDIQSFVDGISEVLKKVDFFDSIKRILNVRDVKYRIYVGGNNSNINLSQILDKDLDSSPNKMVIVSPFIGVDFLESIIRKIKAKNVDVIANASDYTQAMCGFLQSADMKIGFHVVKRQDKDDEDDGNDEDTVESGVYLHAKIYAMDFDGKSVLYIGSPNFSSNGFARNVELLLRIETEDTNFSFAGKLQASIGGENPDKVWNQKSDTREPNRLPEVASNDEETLKEIKERYIRSKRNEKLIDFFCQLFGCKVDDEPTRFAVKRLLDANKEELENIKKKLDKMEIDTEIKSIYDELKSSLESVLDCWN